FSLATSASASALPIPSLMGLGAPSTRSLASFRPKPVRSFTTFTTFNLLGPAAFRMTLKEVFSSAAAAPPPAAGPAATATAAAAGSIPYSSFRILANSLTSFTVSPTNCSANAFKSAIMVNFFRLHSFCSGGAFKKIILPLFTPGPGLYLRHPRGMLSILVSTRSLGPCLQRLDQTSKLARGIQAADDILRRRLQQPDDLTNEIVLALQRGQRLQLIVTGKYIPVDKCRLQGGLLQIPFLPESTQDHRRLLGVLGEQQGRNTIQRLVHAREPGAVDAFQGFLDQGVLSHLHFNILAETDPAELAHLFYRQRF